MRFFTFFLLFFWSSTTTFSYQWHFRYAKSDTGITLAKSVHSKYTTITFRTYLLYFSNDEPKRKIGERFVCQQNVVNSRMLMTKLCICTQRIKKLKNRARQIFFIEISKKLERSKGIGKGCIRVDPPSPKCESYWGLWRFGLRKCKHLEDADRTDNDLTIWKKCY